MEKDKATAVATELPQYVSLASQSLTQGNPTTNHAVHIDTCSGGVSLAETAAGVASQHVLCLAVAVSDGRHEFPPPVQSQPKVPNDSDNDGMVER